MYTSVYKFIGIKLEKSGELALPLISKYLTTPV